MFIDHDQLRRLAGLTNRLDSVLAETGLGRIQKVLDQTSFARTRAITERLRPMAAIHEATRSISPFGGVARTLGVLNAVGATTSLVQFKQLDLLGRFKQLDQLSQFKRLDQFRVARTADALRLGSAFEAIRRVDTVPWLGILAEAERLANATILDPQDVDFALDVWGRFDAAVQRDGTGTSNDGPGISIRLPQLSMSDWIGIFSVLLTVLIFFYQEKESDEGEARQAAEIREVSKEVADLTKIVRKRDADIARIAKVLEQLAANPPLESTSQYVARDRVSVVREARASGGVVAVVHPNQLAECVSTDGKWMKIRFRDWAHDEVVEGWVMKKHWMRVPLRPSHAPQPDRSLSSAQSSD